MEQQSNITSQARIETNVYAEPRRDRLVYELFVKRTAEAIEERLVPALVDQFPAPRSEPHQFVFDCEQRHGEPGLQEVV